MLKLHFTTRHFERSHGRAPKGRGHWGFAEILPNGRPDESNAIFAPGSMTLTAAKKWLSNHLADEGIVGEFEIATLP